MADLESGRDTEALTASRSNLLLMNLESLISKIRLADTDALRSELTESLAPGLEPEVVDSYMAGGASAEAELCFVDAETMPGTVWVDINGVTHQNLFPLAMLQDMVDGIAAQTPAVTDAELAARVLRYYEHDA